MRDKIITSIVTSIGMVTVAGVAGFVATKMISTSNQKDKEELDRRIEEFEIRKQKAIKLEQSKDSKFKEQEEKLKDLKSEIRNLEKLKGELEDSSNLITVISGLTGELKDIKSEVKQMKSELGYLGR